MVRKKLRPILMCENQTKKREHCTGKFTVIELGRSVIEKFC
jgi:hypothetical protein